MQWQVFVPTDIVNRRLTRTSPMPLPRGAFRRWRAQQRRDTVDGQLVSSAMIRTGTA